MFARKRQPVLTIFYQFNTWNSSMGGIQTLIKMFIKYAPQIFVVRLVGTGDERCLSNMKWQEAEFAGREISFLLLFPLKKDNFRSILPTILQYTTALLEH